MELLGGDRRGSRVIGVLSNFLDDPYSVQVVRTAAQKLTQEGCHAVIFTGGFPNAPMFHGPGSTVAVPSALSGLIVLSAMLRAYNPELKGLTAQKSTPVVSIGTELTDAGNITTADETGTFLAVVHLVKHHGCKRIAFISGPEESFDSTRRLVGYREALESFKLPWDPELVTRGDYEASSGREAAIKLCRTAKFDALVAANDLMAIGAIEGLNAAKLRVPQDVKVVGFDDLEEAAFSSPSLTTVRQPMSEQGQAAVEALLKRLGGEPFEGEPHSVPTSLMIRKSCGCHGSKEGVSRPASRVPEDPSAARELHEHRVLVEDAMRGLIRRQMGERRFRRELSHLAEAIIGVSRLPELASALTGVLRLLDVRRLLLCRYTDTQTHARVVFESHGRDVVFRHESHPFLVGALVPYDFFEARRPSHLWIEPLELAGEQLGYLVLETDTAEYRSLLELRHVLSSTLSRIELIAEHRRLCAKERQGDGRGPS